MENNRIVLDYVTGYRGHIGFSCEPEICKLTRSINLGDDVLLILGAVDGKNILKNIRKCVQNDADCKGVAAEDVKKKESDKKASDKRAIEQLACRVRMDDSLEKDSRYISENWIDKIFFNKNYREEYYQLRDDPISGQCIAEIEDAQFDAFIEACEKHGCGDNIGGGCYHIAGYTTFDAAIKYAVKQCRN